jgi:hypothetical protein
MQVFEVIELREHPHFVTIEINDVETVKNVINDLNSHKVYLLVDHESRKIWTYNGPNSPLKLQVYGGILAGMLRKQVSMFYRTFSMNKYLKTDPEFEEILNKTVEIGKAKEITKNDFPGVSEEQVTTDLHIVTPKLTTALQMINEYPKPEHFKRIFLIVGSILYSEEEIIESFFKEGKRLIKELKLGRLNNGFTFLNDRNYAIRILVRDRAIQGIELYTPYYEEDPTLRLEIPIIEEEKFSKEGNIKALLKAFQIPDSLPDDEKSRETNLNNLP